MKFNKLIPELSVKDINRSIQFYVGILGFTINYQRPEAKFVFISYQGSQIMIEEINHHWQTSELEYPFGRGINFQIEVESVDYLRNNLSTNKYPLFKDVMENWYRQEGKLLGNREFLVQDPDGYLLRFSEDLGARDVE